MTLLSTGGSLAHGASVQLEHSSKDRLIRRATETPVSYVAAVSGDSRTGTLSTARAQAHPVRSGKEPAFSLANHPKVYYSAEMSSDQAPVTPPGQTVSLGATLTNFTNEPLAPALNLFNPTQGTLLSVAVSHSAMLQGNITSQNLSPSSPALITAGFSGSYQINGLNQPISQPTRSQTNGPVPAGVYGSGTDTVTFPPFLLSDASTETFNDPASLAFFTASSGRSETTVTMSATASASASSPNGNLLTTAQSSAASTVTVIYTYAPPECPSVAGIGRVGVHHQRTQLIVTFDGIVDATKAENPSNYSVKTPTGQTVRVKSASYNPTTNSVTLIPARRLNVHHHFRLFINLPCAGNQPSETAVVPFGGKRSLIGFHDHRGEFVSVKNGKIDGFYRYQDQFVPIRDGKIVRLMRS
jgi:hypothetical protein